MQMKSNFAERCTPKNIVLSENGSTNSRHRKVRWQEQLRQSNTEQPGAGTARPRNDAALSVQPPVKCRGEDMNVPTLNAQTANTYRRGDQMQPTQPLRATFL